MKLELDAPNVGELEKEYIGKAIDSGFISTFGQFVPEFESRFARYLQSDKAVAVQSGTAAIHMALYELGIGSGDEVIVPNLTFVATVNPIIYVGAEPVFVDIDNRTWNISVLDIEKNISKKTKAIIVVHLYGNPCGMDQILDIAKKYNLYVIEDATESLGATYKGKFTGTLGNLGCFSFNGNKTITTGGGGMVVGDDSKSLEHTRFLVNQARDSSKGYFHPEVGFNYRMTNIEAALGLAQMERLDDFLMKKKTFYNIYKEELKNISCVQFQEEESESDSSRWLTTVTVNKDIDLVGLGEELKNRGVPTRRVFMPVSEFPPYQKYKRDKYPRAYAIYEKGLCLPSSTVNSKESVYYACKVLKDLIE